MVIAGRIYADDGFGGLLYVPYTAPQYAAAWDFTLRGVLVEGNPGWQRGEELH